MRWRELDGNDAAALVALAGRVLEVDGGHPVVGEEGFLRGRFLSGESTGAFTEDGELVAAAGVRPVGETTAGIGAVHPAHRGQGLGIRLLDWILARAARVETEALTDAADKLFRVRGLRRTFAEDIMRADLLRMAPAPGLPPGVTLTGWEAAGSQRFFDVYSAAFADRPGFPGWSHEQWTDWIAGDDEFAPQWTVLATKDGRDAGFVAGARDGDGPGWIVQVGVIPQLRGCGLGAGLTGEAMRRMRADGVDAAMLDVNENNPGAARTYERLGFQRIGRRARYEAG